MELRRSRSRRTQAAAADWVNAVAFSPDGEQVAAAAADGSITLLEPGGRERVLARHEQTATSVTFSVDGRLASGGQDGQVLIDGTSSRVGSDWVQALAWRPDGAVLRPDMPGSPARARHGRGCGR